jgi:hypothetical protein
MGLLVPTRRVYHGWRKVLPLYDGRECPDCGAVILGREGRRLHREHHLRLEAWQDQVVAALRAVSRYAGMTVLEHDDGEPNSGEGYNRVNLRVPEYDDDEEDDDE